MKNEVEVRVAVYEVGGEDVSPVDGPVLLVKSHWNRADMVVLHAEDQKSVTVSARNLIEAVRSATESRR